MIAIVSRLSLGIKTIHAQFKIPDNTLPKLALAHVFIIDKMLLSNIILSFIYTRTKQSNVQNPFTFKMLFIIHWKPNTIIAHLRPLDPWWKYCLWYVPHLKMAIQDLWPTLFLTFIHMPCLRPKTFKIFEHHKRETTNSRRNWCLSIVKYYTSK